MGNMKRTNDIPLPWTERHEEAMVEIGFGGLILSALLVVFSPFLVMMGLGNIGEIVFVSGILGMIAHFVLFFWVV